MIEDRRRHNKETEMYRSNGRSSGGERLFIEQIAAESLKEQRTARRWGVFFKCLAFSYIGFGLLLAGRNGLFNLQFEEPEEHTAVVNVEGEIAADSSASAKRIVAGLEAAFESDKTKAVILLVNSGGGSPVQSAVVFDEVQRLRAEHEDVPLYSVISDIGASGGYYIASAADKIYAEKASLVGSIGVRSGGFGFVETLDKFGVERRVLTSGDNKAFLDPFSPMKDDEVAHMETLLDSIHQQFITAVKEGRGEALSDDVFSGLMWTGEQALNIGLVDGIGSELSVARDIFNTEKIVNFTPKDGFIEQLAGGIGMTISDRLVELFQRLKVQ